MNNEHELAIADESNYSEESENSLEADMHDEQTIGSPATLDNERSERDEEGNDVLDELEGMRPQRRIAFAQIEEGEVSEFNIPLDPTDSETLKRLFNRTESNYLVYYTKCVIYLVQKYGALTVKQMASLIGNLGPKHLYDIINVLSEFKIFSRDSRDEGCLFKICAESPVPDPITDLNVLDNEISEIYAQIEHIQNLIDES